MSESIWPTIIAVAAIGGALYYHYSKDEEQQPIAPPIIKPVELDTIITVLDTGSIWKLDVSTVTGKRDARQGWVIQNHKDDKTISHRETKILWRVNCETTSYQTLAATAYSPSGDPTTLWEDSVDEAKTTYARPDSNAAAVVESICTKTLD